MGWPIFDAMLLVHSKLGGVTMMLFFAIAAYNHLYETIESWCGFESRDWNGRSWAGESTLTSSRSS